MSLLKRKPRSNLIATSDYLKVGYKDDGVRLLQKQQMKRQRVQNASAGYQEEYFSKTAATQHWDKLPRETAGETSLKVFKPQ